MPDSTARRKTEHLKIIEENGVQSLVAPGWDDYRFVHNALPNLDLREIDLSTAAFGRRLSAPIIISSMTGGTSDAGELNRRMAKVAQHRGIAMGVGSQRIALEDRESIENFRVRSVAPDILLFANLGAVQLNYGVTPKDCAWVVEAIEADALYLHLNALQEALQLEGNTNFRGLIGRIAAVCAAVPVPVIAKEVGWGISGEVACQLREAGVAGIDVAGAGGTSWSAVEQARAGSRLLATVADAFAGWGIPSAEAVKQVRKACPDAKIIASGGLRSGVDVAKALALGADLCGLAAPVIRAAMKGTDEAEFLLSAVIEQLRLAMFGIGAGDLEALKGTSRLKRPGS